MSAVRVCFVCLGNICRSPTAEAVMTALVDEQGLGERIVVESAGTAGWHEGEHPDPRAIAEVERRGGSMRSRGRQFRRADFDRFDVVVAMDGKNHRTLSELAPTAADAEKVRLMRDFAAGPPGRDVPDPYYDRDEGFAKVYDLIEEACQGLLDHLRSENVLS